MRRLVRLFGVRHGCRAACHGWLTLAVAGAAGGCAPKTGWERTDVRACAPDSPAVVCVQAESDPAVMLRVGDVTLLPGECAVAPRANAHGTLAVQMKRERQPATTQRIRVARASMTVVSLDDQDKLTVVQRPRCDGSVVSPR